MVPATSDGWGQTARKRRLIWCVAERTYHKAFVRKIHTHSRLPAIFTEDDNFCDFLFAILYSLFQTPGRLLKERICSSGVLTVLSPMQVFPFPFSGSYILFRRYARVMAPTSPRQILTTRMHFCYKHQPEVLEVNSSNNDECTPSQHLY